MLDDVFKHNQLFVATQAYKPFLTDKFPDRRVAILTCMDTRLVELLPAALGYRNGDVKILKNAGGIISHPYGSVIRSLIVAIYELGVDTIWVIGHTDCGMEHLEVSHLLDKMVQRGIKRETIDAIGQQGVDYEAWLGGFANVREAILDTMEQIHHHPLIPQDIQIEGMLIDSVTGALQAIHTIQACKDTAQR